MKLLKEYITWNKNLEAKDFPGSNVVDLITEALVPISLFYERLNQQRYSTITS